MHLGVILEMRGLIKARAANVAPVGFFPGVNAPVIPESRMPSERLFADFADVRAFARVDPFVIFQVRGLGELHAAYITPVGFLPGVNAGVVFEIGGFGKC